MKESHIKILKRFLLFFILLVTLFLSVKQIGPFDSSDERMVANHVWSLHDETFPVNQYPPFILYLHFIFSIICREVLLLLGFIKNSSEFMQSGYGYFFTIEAGRILSAFFGTFLIYFVYKIGKRFYNENVAFCAVLILAFNKLFILHSHIFKSDIIASFFLTVSLYFILKFLKTYGPKDIFISSFFCGLSVAAKYNTFPFIFAILLAIILIRKELDGKRIKRTLIFLPIGTAVGFFAGAPNWLVHPIGNLKLFFNAYNFKSGVVFNFGFGGRDSAIEIFLKLIEGFIRNFGLIFIIILVISILVGIITKNKRDILITFFILIYILIFLQTGFYADRFGLPLYSAITLLMGKFIFIDFKKFYRRYPRYWQYVVVLIWIPVLIYAFNNIKVNSKSFNILKTTLKKDWVVQYREKHNIVNKKYKVGSQWLTPRYKNDIRLTGRFMLQRQRRKKVKSFLHVIQANLHYYNMFRKGDDILTSRSINLGRYLPFYRIEKPKFQPWDYNYILLYRISKELMGITKKRSDIELPRAFCNGNLTSFFPLQIYEKNSGFWKMEDRKISFWLYSKKEIKKLKIYLFSLQERSNLIIGINDVSFDLVEQKRKFLEIVKIPDLRPKRFYHDYVYQIELYNKVKKSKRKTQYFVFYPIYENQPLTKKDSPILFSNRLQKDIPKPFSKERYPAWIKLFYRKTGIDLSLLTFINTNHIYINTENSLNDISCDIIPLEGGYYSVSIIGEKIVNAVPVESKAYMRYQIYSLNEYQEREIELNREHISNIQLDVAGPISFVKIEFKGLRENNYLIKRVSITPDYKQFINTHLVKKN